MVLVSACLRDGRSHRLPVAETGSLAGVPGDDISIIHRDTSRPLGRVHSDDLPSWSGGPLAWTELAVASRQYARAVPQYLTFMSCAGVIAAFGVLTKSATLIVGAMAMDSDLLPLCATCVGWSTAGAGWPPGQSWPSSSGWLWRR